MMDQVGSMGVEAIKYLVEVGKELSGVHKTEINGEIYVDKNMHRVDKHDHSAPGTFETFTLRGLIDWIKADCDENFDKYGQLVVNVENAGCVRVYTPAHGNYGNVRDELAVCHAFPCNFRFGQYINQEDFIVALQALFVKTEVRDKVGEVVGNLRAEAQAETADDGISQRVTVKTGIAKVGSTVLHNPAFLAPYRTFIEIEQPESPFVLRIKSSGEKGEAPMAALFEADGSMWKIIAVERIGNYLRQSLANYDVTVIS